MATKERSTRGIPGSTAGGTPAAALFTGLLALVAAGCSGDSTSGPDPVPSVGQIHVSALTSGSDVDPDGYTVALDGGAAQALGINGSLTVSPSSTGTHSVLLGGIAANCSVGGGNPKTASVGASGSVQVAFSVSCAALPVILTGKVAFETNRTGNYEVFVMNADGSNPVNLSNNPSYDFEPDFSPDGSKIVFVSRRDGNDEIYVMNADGSGQTRLTNNPATERGPEWSPDGSKILFESDRDGNDEVYVMSANGTGVTNLTNHAADDDHPAWSPDGSKIAFQSTRNGAKGLEVYVMNANGANPVDLSNHSAAFDGRPAWSPDGSKLAFVSSRDNNLEIYVMNADGSGQTRITNEPELDSYPVWSPDGGTLAFRSDRTGNIEVFTIKANGTGPVDRTNNTATDCHPSWTGAGAASLRSGAALTVPGGGAGSALRIARTSLAAQLAMEQSCLGN